METAGSGHFGEMITTTCQRLAIRLRIVGLQADVHREAMNPRHFQRMLTTMCQRLDAL